jgi:uncharacterized coiled-coil protein SlyX
LWVAVGDKPDGQQDLEARLAVLETTLAERDTELAKRGAELAERDARLAEQDAKIAALTEQVAKLTELLSRNSKNSHLPPSSDEPGACGAASGRRSKSKRKRGGQKGHRGNHRELLPPERVDELGLLGREHADVLARSLRGTPPPRPARRPTRRWRSIPPDPLTHDPPSARATAHPAPRSTRRARLRRPCSSSMERRDDGRHGGHGVPRRDPRPIIRFLPPS